MFWKNYVLLCNKNGKTPNGVCADLGLSSAIATRWKKGSVPRDTTLKRIADYFGITVEELLRDPADQTAEITSSQTNHPMLDARFYELLDQLTLKELRELKAQMEETIKNRK